MCVLGSASPGAFLKCGIYVCRSSRRALVWEGTAELGWGNVPVCRGVVNSVSLWHFCHRDCSTAFSGCWGWREWQSENNSGSRMDPPQPPLSLEGYKWISRERQEQGEFVGITDLKPFSTCSIWDFLSLWSDCSVTQVSPSGREVIRDQNCTLRLKCG